MRTRKPIKAYLREKRRARHRRTRGKSFVIHGTHLALTSRDIAEICGMRVEIIESALERVSLAIMEGKIIDLGFLKKGETK